MIRFIHCVKAHPELTSTEFRRFFQGEEMASLVRALATSTSAVDYRLSLTLEIEMNLELMRSRGGAEPFDALVEVRWESGKELMQNAETDEFKALMERIDEFQRQFIDFSKSSRFFVED